MGGMVVSSATRAPGSRTAQQEKLEDRAALERLAQQNRHGELDCPDCGTSVQSGELVRHYDEHHAWERDSQPLRFATGPGHRTGAYAGICFFSAIALMILRAALGPETLWGRVAGALGILIFVLCGAAVLLMFFANASLEDAGDHLLLRRSLGRPLRLRPPISSQSVGEMTSSSRSSSNENVTEHSQEGIYLRLAFTEKALIVNCVDESLYTFQSRWDPSVCITDKSRDHGSAHIRLGREDFYALQLWLQQHGVLVPNPLSLRRR